MKSYGRAPTFLLLTGYEQVRSIAAELAGDHQAARDVQLVLPKNRRLHYRRRWLILLQRPRDDGRGIRGVVVLQPHPPRPRRPPAAPAARTEPDPA